MTTPLPPKFDTQTVLAPSDGLNGRTSSAPACPDCSGIGEVFTHADDCTGDLCALNGDMHSCAGQLARCSCTAGMGSAAALQQVIQCKYPTDAQKCSSVLSVDVNAGAVQADRTTRGAALPDRAQDFAKLNAHSRVFMKALADLVCLPSREFKGDAMRREWIDREQAMRLVAPLRDNASALATLLREELKRAHCVPVDPDVQALRTIINAVRILSQRPRPLCRDCADEDGTCPTSGLPCDLPAAIVAAEGALGVLGLATINKKEPCDGHL